MSYMYMVRLVGKKLQILNGVIAGIAVYVVNNFTQFKVSAKMLFHNVSMLKHIFCTGHFSIRRAWMAIVNHNHNITVLPDFFTAVPSWGFRLGKSIHGIIFSGQTPSVHWVILTRYITVISRVGISKISRSYGTAKRAVFSVWLRSIFPKEGITLFAGNLFAGFLCFANTFHRAVFRFYRRIRFVFITTVGAGSSNHVLNYTGRW